MIKKTIFLIFLIVGISGAQDWAPLPGLYDGQVTGLSAGSNGTIWAGTAGGGVFKSADRGESWSAVNAGLLNLHLTSIASSPVSGDVFAGTNTGVFKLSKGSGSWQEINYNLPKVYPWDVPWISSLVFNEKGDLFAGEWYGFIWRLPTRATRWECPGEVNRQLWNSITASASGKIWAAGFGLGANSVVSSADNGTSWTPATKPPYPQVASIAVDETGGIVYAGERFGAWGGGGGIYRSVNNGRLWENSGIKNEQINAVLVSGKKVFAGSGKKTGYGGLYVSSDKGLSWTGVTAGLSGLSEVRAIIASGDAIFVAANGVYRSDDGGVTFRKASAGLKVPVLASGIAITPKGDVYACSNGSGIFCLPAGAKSWENANAGLEDINITALIINGLSEPVAATGNGTAYRLKGNGKSWTKSNLKTNLLVRTLALAANKNILAGVKTSEGIFVSSDNGDTFLPCKPPLMDQVIDLYTAPGGEILAGTEKNYLQISSDNGQSFTVIGRPPNGGGNTTSVGATPAGTVLAGVGGILFEYLGGGKWAQPVFPAKRVVVSDLLLNRAKTKVFAASNKGVYYSTDAKEWKEMNSGLVSHEVRTLAMDDKDSLYAGTAEGIFKTTK